MKTSEEILDFLRSARELGVTRLKVELDGTVVEAELERPADIDDDVRDFIAQFPDVVDEIRQKRERAQREKDMFHSVE